MQIRAALCREFGRPLTIETIQVSEPAANEVVVDIAACAICHSDITFIDGGWGGTLPALYGHEASGVVRTVGSNVTAYQPGDRVLVTLIRACGHCHACEGGHPVRCGGAGAAGVSAVPITTDAGQPITHGMDTGAFAEQALVHESQLCKIPSDLPFDVASLLSCGVITGLGAVFNTAKLEPGSHVAVIGAGGVGLNTIQGARLAGAARIVALDIASEKLEIAKVFGATDAFDPTDPNLQGALDALTNGRGLDAVFVTVGSKRVLDAALDHLGAGGAMVIVGMTPAGVVSEYDPGSFAYYCQRILGSRMGEGRLSRDIPMLIDLYRQGRLKLDELISNRFAFDDINAAIASAREGGTIRNVLLMPAYEDMSA